MGVKHKENNYSHDKNVEEMFYICELWNGLKGVLTLGLNFMEFHIS